MHFQFLLYFYLPTFLLSFILFFLFFFYNRVRRHCYSFYFINNNNKIIRITIRMQMIVTIRIITMRTILKLQNTYIFSQEECIFFNHKPSLLLIIPIFPSYKLNLMNDPLPWLVQTENTSLWLDEMESVVFWLVKSKRVGNPDWMTEMDILDRDWMWKWYICASMKRWEETCPA